MTLDELKALEKRLEAGENGFLSTRDYDIESAEIWRQLRELLARVTAHRIRKEIAEQKESRT